MRLQNDFHNKILIIVNWIYQKKQQGARYEDVYRAYCYYFRGSWVSTETFARKLRKMAEEGIFIKNYDNKRVLYVPQNPFEINDNPKLHYFKGELKVSYKVGSELL